MLSIPGAVPGAPDSPDSAVAWHYGDPFGEQRAAVTQAVTVDRSHRFLIAITGPERLSWLHSISSQHVSELADRTTTENLILDTNGRVEHHFVLTDVDGTLWLDTEAATGPALVDYLRKMVFWAQVEVREANDFAVLSALGPAFQVPRLEQGFARPMPWPTPHAHDLVVPRDRLADYASLARPAGLWAFEALRVAAHRPRLGIDTDERTIPHEVGWIGAAVHLDKGCYRGQETVARVHNLGRPPRHLVLLHLDGSTEERPVPGTDVTAAGRTVGRVGTVVDHFELGPIALALIKRTVPADTELVAGPCAAAIDPDSVPGYDEPQAGRLAVDRLRGR